MIFVTVIMQQRIVTPDNNQLQQNINNPAAQQMVDQKQNIPQNNGKYVSVSHISYKIIISINVL